MSCPSLETAAAWVLGEAPADALERFEEHYFGCDLCLARTARLQRVVELLRASVPLVLTADRRRELEALYPGLPAVKVDPGQRATIRLGPSIPVGIWTMGAPLARAKRVDLEALDARGVSMMLLRDVPFDAARGEVLMPCQWHYRVIGGTTSELHIRLTLDEPGGARPVFEYILDHEFESL